MKYSTFSSLEFAGAVYKATNVQLNMFLINSMINKNTTALLLNRLLLLDEELRILIITLLESDTV